MIMMVIVIMFNRYE